MPRFSIIYDTLFVFCIPYCTNTDLYVGSTPAKQRIPLSYHVNQIAAHLEGQADRLRAKGKRSMIDI